MGPWAENENILRFLSVTERAFPCRGLVEAMENREKDFLFVFAISGNLSKSAFFEGVGHFERKFHTVWDLAHQALLVSQN